MHLFCPRELSDFRSARQRRFGKTRAELWSGFDLSKAVSENEVKLPAELMDMFAARKNVEDRPQPLQSEGSR